MAWTSGIKYIDVASKVPHAHSKRSVTGVTPFNSQISFNNLELFGAAARCSHLHQVNPAIAGLEVDMLSKLIEPHVDNLTQDFAILSSADSFKDFVKSYFAGTVAAGLAYLIMIREGYVWSDHFENVGGGNTSYTRKPDFVFAHPHYPVALMESKGTRSSNLSGFDATVRDGYTGQVEPHLGYKVGGVVASHGYCVGAHMTSTTKAEILIHHTAPPPLSSGAAFVRRGQTPLLEIQRQSFATAFSLSHSASLGTLIRQPDRNEIDIPFYRFNWRGRNWVTNLSNLSLTTPWSDFFPWPLIHVRPTGLMFALEENIASTALQAFLGRPQGERMSIEPMSELPEDSNFPQENDVTGVVFPDGLAVFDDSHGRISLQPIKWNGNERKFRESW